jgi:predicted NUDIX family NTP pyrophosphohydrolase
MASAQEPASRSVRTSAGILLWRRRKGRLEVLLGHPGGPFFANKDADNWTVPKGEAEPGEVLLMVALREFHEETGHELPDHALIEIGEIRQKGGKVVVAWGAEGELDPAAATSNTFEMQWPPRSGWTQEYPELDRVEWFDVSTARVKIKAAQRPFLDRLQETLGEASSA